MEPSLVAVPPVFRPQGRGANQSRPLWKTVLGPPLVSYWSIHVIKRIVCQHLTNDILSNIFTSIDNRIRWSYITNRP